MLAKLWHKVFHTRLVFCLLFIAMIVLVDQLTKCLVLEKLSGGVKSITVTPFLNIVLVWNKGVTFGMLNNPDWYSFMPYVLIALAAAIVALLIRWMLRTSSFIVSFALALVIGGAVGNIIDRIIHGAVLDFLDFHYAGYHWYAFNIADAAIVIGVALLFLDTVIRGR
ncbi:MAG: signal peptidase II [Alphaproteobacteria bacterium]|nr:signal peptidase II [Alphaproteobacteria bacterium]MCL2505857.1 signal peptidase II [Alphaproteobacteria bacterium]